MLRRVHKYGHAHELLLTFGLAFIIEEVIKLFYGDALVSYQMPDYMRFAAFTIFETNYPFYRLFMGAVALGHVRRRSTCCSRAPASASSCAPPPTGRPTVEALGHNLPLVFMGGVRRRLGPGRPGRRRGRRLLPDRPQHGRRLRHAGLRRRRHRRARLGRRRAHRLADDRPVHLLLGRPQRVDRRPARPVRARRRGPSELGGLFTLQLSTIANSMPFLLMLLVLLIRPAGLMGDRQ